MIGTALDKVGAYNDLDNSQQFVEEINEKSLRHLSNRRFKRDFMLAVGNSSDPLPTCFRVIFEII